MQTSTTQAYPIVEVFQPHVRTDLVIVQNRRICAGTNRLPWNEFGELM